MAKKIDLSGMKEFLFNHGEKVTLGACAFLGVVLGLWGVWSAFGAGRDTNGKLYTDLFSDKAKTIKSGLDRPFIPDAEGPVAVATKSPDWPHLKSTHQQTPLIAIADVNNDKRQRPKVLPIVIEPDGMKYVNGLVYLHHGGMTNRIERAARASKRPGRVPTCRPSAHSRAQRARRASNRLRWLALGANVAIRQGRSPQRMVVVRPLPDEAANGRVQKALRMAQQMKCAKNRDDLRPLGSTSFASSAAGRQGEADAVIGYVTVRTIRSRRRSNSPSTRNSKTCCAGDLRRTLAGDDEDFIERPDHADAALANRHYPKFEMKGFDLDWASPGR